MISEKNKTARRLFAPIAGDYGIWSRILSFGQDPRWRRMMLKNLGLTRGARVLDVAAGTGEVTRLLQQAGSTVFSLDLSPDMLAEARAKGALAVLARAEELPFLDSAFDALTFTYLLRYVEHPRECLRELARVLRPGGRAGMVEFGRPRKAWGLLWFFYTRTCLPLAGKLIGRGCCCRRWCRDAAQPGATLFEHPGPVCPPQGQNRQSAFSNRIRRRGMGK